MTAILLVLMLGRAVAAQDHQHGGDPASVGTVRFPTSCSAAVQPRFERAVAMLHSFWFEQAHAAFEEIVSDDPGCAMAQWGIAMTLLGNPYTGVAPQPSRQVAATTAARRAVALAATATPRERGYAEAALALHDTEAMADFRARMAAHEAAMQRVHERFPDDPEATMYYARAVISNAPPSDLAFERQRHAAALLEPLFAQHPDHPGLAHYIIHAYDSPALAAHGLDAARRYAGIAPSAPHALHMPSHIFTRLGHWDESIETNARSAAAEPNPDAAVHPMDYLVYAYLQQGRHAEAKRVVDRAIQLPDRFYGGILGYNFAAMPARYALERGEWGTAAVLPVPGGGAPFVPAITRFARAVGAARGGDVASARREIAALDSLRGALERANERYWVTIVEAQRLAASAWVARAEGNDAEAMRLARAGAELEETVEKHPVTPGPLLPARELEADLLLELGRASDAFRSYERTLEREPRRARTLYGAARAAEAAGDAAAARRMYTALADLMAKADPDRPEARAARAYLGGDDS
jgi:tetratricopeptide (TPR) repeat protein